MDLDKNVYVADSLNDTIRKISSGGDVTTLAGSPGVRGSGNGTGSSAHFNQPRGIAVDRETELFKWQDTDANDIPVRSRQRVS